jgi:hypothetical protein
MRTDLFFSVDNDNQAFIQIRPFGPGCGDACRLISSLHFLHRVSMRSLTFLVVLTGVAGLVNAAEVECIDEDLASIYGLKPGQQAKGYLPSNYHSVESLSGEDDGGFYVANKYIYEQFEVNTVRGHVDSIVIASPDLVWAEGIKLGMNRSDVEHALGLARVYTDESLSQYLVCSEAGDVYTLLRFRRNRLESVEVAIDRP